MIVGIGCDMVDHGITKSLGWPLLPKKIHRIFTPPELSLLTDSNRIKFLSGRFAAKEAFLKALKTGWRGKITWQDIEIVSDKKGAPSLKIHGEAKNILKKLGADCMHLSISHTGDHAIAEVILEKADSGSV